MSAGSSLAGATRTNVATLAMALLAYQWMIEHFANMQMDKSFPGMTANYDYEIEFNGTRCCL